MPKTSASTSTFSRNHFAKFLHHFWRGHLIWSTTTVFVLVASFKPCHTIFYRCKRRSRLAWSGIWLGFDIGRTETFRLKILHQTTTNFSIERLDNVASSWIPGNPVKQFAFTNCLTSHDGNVISPKLGKSSSERRKVHKRAFDTFPNGSAAVQTRKRITCKNTRPIFEWLM